MGKIIIDDSPVFNDLIEMEPAHELALDGPQAEISRMMTRIIEMGLYERLARLVMELR